MPVNSFRQLLWDYPRAISLGLLTALVIRQANRMNSSDRTPKAAGQKSADVEVQENRTQAVDKAPEPDKTLRAEADLTESIIGRIFIKLFPWQYN